jgi:2-polyprenyl-6-methoxyphenol hydroxylase-like FAD-dependent oxidoreductase
MLAEAAREYPTFHLEMGARVEQLIRENGVTTGVRYRARDGVHEIRAQLVVGADGRFSKVRQLAEIPLTTLDQGFDLLQMRIPKAPAADPPRAYGLYPGDRALLVVSLRFDVWQISLAFPKGTYQQLRQAGIDGVRNAVARLAPWTADRLQIIDDWNHTRQRTRSPLIRAGQSPLSGCAASTPRGTRRLRGAHSAPATSDPGSRSASVVPSEYRLPRPNSLTGPAGQRYPSSSRGRYPH